RGPRPAAPRGADVPAGRRRPGSGTYGAVFPAAGTIRFRPNVGDSRSESPLPEMVTRGASHPHSRRPMVVARQAVITEPYQAAVREVTLPDPAPNQILLAAEYSAVSAGTELAVYTGTHQWLKDPALTEWKFPF